MIDVHRLTNIAGSFRVGAPMAPFAILTERLAAIGGATLVGRLCRLTPLLAAPAENSLMGRIVRGLPPPPWTRAPQTETDGENR